MPRPPPRSTLFPSTTLFRSVEDLMEFETRVNYVVPKYDDIVICAYDLSKFGASVVMDALRTHPAVIIGGVLEENPFFVPPEPFLQIGRGPWWGREGVSVVAGLLKKKREITRRMSLC